MKSTRSSNTRRRTSCTATPANNAPRSNTRTAHQLNRDANQQRTRSTPVRGPHLTSKKERRGQTPRRRDAGSRRANPPRRAAGRHAGGPRASTRPPNHRATPAFGPPLQAAAKRRGVSRWLLAGGRPPRSAQEAGASQSRRARRDRSRLLGPHGPARFAPHRSRGETPHAAAPPSAAAVLSRWALRGGRPRGSGVPSACSCGSWLPLRSVPPPAGDPPPLRGGQARRTDPAASGAVPGSARSDRILQPPRDLRSHSALRASSKTSRPWSRSKRAKPSSARKPERRWEATPGLGGGGPSPKTHPRPALHTRAYPRVRQTPNNARTRPTPPPLRVVC